MAIDDMPAHVRAGLGDLEIRGDGRTIVGLAVPFDTPTSIVDHQGAYHESFRFGAFTKTLAERGVGKVKLYVNHGHIQRELPIGRATMLREDSAGLVGEWRVSNVPEGDRALELVRDGVLDSLSVGVRDVAGATVWSGAKSSTSPMGTAAERTQVRLEEVSLVAHPAFDTATISAVRDTITATIDMAGEMAEPHDETEAGQTTSVITPRMRRIWLARFAGFTPSKDLEQ